MKDWNIKEMTGYEPKTTFYTDFSIAEPFGFDAVIETYHSAMLWKNDYEYLTELVMALNWKIWEHWESNRHLAELYNDLWEQADNYAVKNLKGKELEYFYRTTD